MIQVFKRNRPQHQQPAFRPRVGQPQRPLQLPQRSAPQGLLGDIDLMVVGPTGLFIWDDKDAGRWTAQTMDTPEGRMKIVKSMVKMRSRTMYALEDILRDIPGSSPQMGLVFQAYMPSVRELNGGGFKINLAMGNTDAWNIMANGPQVFAQEQINKIHFEASFVKGTLQGPATGKSPTFLQGERAEDETAATFRYKAAEHVRKVGGPEWMFVRNIQFPPTPMERQVWAQQSKTG